jgi:hypothetical protein
LKSILCYRVGSFDLLGTPSSQHHQLKTAHHQIDGYSYLSDENRKGNSHDDEVNHCLAPLLRVGTCGPESPTIKVLSSSVPALIVWGLLLLLQV